MSSRGPGKQRADTLLVDRGLAPSRERARALILAGKVLAGERPVEKAGELVELERRVRLRGEPTSRTCRAAGSSSRTRSTHFALDVRARWRSTSARRPAASPTCCSSAARRASTPSTSGTASSPGSCARIRAWSCIEQVNIRHLDRALPEPPGLVVCDVSFISLTLVLPGWRRSARARTPLVALVKPQFEVGSGDVGKGGVVRDPDARRRPSTECRESRARARLPSTGVVESPITGPAGNVEYLLARRAP